MHHRSRYTNNGLVLTLSKPILMGVVRNDQLHPYTLRGVESYRLCGGILTPIVRPQDLDISPCLVLHKRLKLLEPIEYLSLGLQDVYPDLPRVVINESHMVLTTTQGNRWHRPTHISVYQIKYPSRSTVTTGKDSLGVLTKSTSSANLLMLNA